VEALHAADYSRAYARLKSKTLALVAIFRADDRANLRQTLDHMLASCMIIGQKNTSL